jgi:hypothetical protein
MKKNIIYILILIMLTISAVYLMRKPVKTTADFESEVLATDSLRILEFVFEKNGISTVLTKGLNGWMVKGDKISTADINSVNPVIDYLSNVRLVNVISENPEKLKKFGFDENAVTITVRRDDNRSVKFTVGSDDRDRNHSFIRIPGDDRTYLGTLFPRYRIPADQSGWRNKTISAFSADDLESVTVMNKGSVFEMNRQGSAWSVKINGKDKDDAGIAEKIASKLSNFRAAGFSDGTGIGDISDPVTVIFTVKGVKKEFAAGKHGEDYVLYSKENEQAYKITSSETDLFAGVFK